MEEGSFEPFEIETNGSDNVSLITDSGGKPGCVDAYDSIIVPRFYLVCVAGFITSIISILENSFLFFLFLQKKSNRNHYNLYLMLIALIDVFIGISYIFLMVVNVSADYFQSLILLRLWYFYVAPMITISHVAITSSAMCILAATFERYCITVNSRCTDFVKRNRIFIAFGSLIIAIFNKGSIYFELRITKNEACVGTMNEYAIIATPLVESTYYVIFKVWYRNIATVFLPFFALAYLNAKIVRALAKQQRLDYCADLILANSKNHPDKEKSRRKILTRSATRTLVLVVITYLISNVVNVILTVGEYFNKMQLTNYYIDVYFILLDSSSFLCVVASALRFPIYMTCQSQLRNEFIDLLKHKLRKNSFEGECNNSSTSNNNTGVPLLSYEKNQKVLKRRSVSEDNIKSTEVNNTASSLKSLPEQKIIQSKNIVEANIEADVSFIDNDDWDVNDPVTSQRLKTSENNDFLQNIIFRSSQKESVL
uniref:G_PROTEIN_RECEP_F1_2 domain-containing protein n=1 Tax=Parastrongyloides trichosuri TaxID=131310 RepID=A0A0N4Z533_PARTI